MPLRQAASIRRRQERGFTFVELLVLLFASIIMVAAISYLSRRVGNTMSRSKSFKCESMRFAMEFLKNDLRGTGRLTVVNGIEVGARLDAIGRDPGFCSVRSGLRAIELVERSPDTPESLTRFGNNLHLTV